MSVTVEARVEDESVTCRVMLFALLSALAVSVCLGRDFEVKLISGSDEAGVWGTTEYEVAVNKAGVMRYLKVRGHELVWQAAALYTSPIPAGSEKGIRTVQGEGGWGKTTRLLCADRKGVRTFRFRHILAKPAILKGQVFCEIDQTIVLTPTGEVSVQYDCLWPRTCRWRSFGVLMFFSLDTMRGCRYMGLRGEQVFTGLLKAAGSSPSAARLREPLDQLTIWSPEGPVHLIWHSPPKLSFGWLKHIQLHVRCPRAPYRGTIYKGTSDTIAYRVLLPVSQQ